jgi:hypothetical protein
MKKIHASSRAHTNFNSDNPPVIFKAFPPKEQMGNAKPDLHPPLAGLHAAHKGMHPVLFTVLAAFREIVHKQGTIVELGK